MRYRFRVGVAIIAAAALSGCSVNEGHSTKVLTAFNEAVDEVAKGLEMPSTSKIKSTEASDKVVEVITEHRIDFNNDGFVDEDEALSLRHRLTGTRLSPEITTTLSAHAALPLIHLFTAGESPFVAKWGHNLFGKVGTITIETATVSAKDDEARVSFQPTTTTMTRRGDGGYDYVSSGGGGAFVAEGVSIRVGELASDGYYIAANGDYSGTFTLAPIEVAYGGVTTRVASFKQVASQSGYQEVLQNFDMQYTLEGVEIDMPILAQMGLERWNGELTLKGVNLPVTFLTAQAEKEKETAFPDLIELLSAARDRVMLEGSVGIEANGKALRAGMAGSAPPPPKDLTRQGADPWLQKNLTLSVTGEVPADFKDLIAGFRPQLLVAGIVESDAETGTLKLNARLQDEVVVLGDGSRYSIDEFGALLSDQ